MASFTGMNGEQGLLGLAFDPSYASNGLFYLVYTARRSGDPGGSVLTLKRFTVSANAHVADPASGSTVLTVDHPTNTNHNGGMLAFGPDGYLYWSTGDGGNGGDPPNNAQNLSVLLGKILRLDVHSASPYAVPSTNPFVETPVDNPATRGEIWAYGLRNPWRFSFDRSTGDLYVGDVGQNIEEEVDFQLSASLGGQNYGWRIREGNRCYDPSSGCVSPPGYVGPVATYDHGLNDSYGCSITGGYVYRGTSSPSLQGVYFYGDFCSGKVLGLIKNPDSTWTSNLIVSTSHSISSFGQDEQGELYLLDYGVGALYQILSTPPTISGNVGVEAATLSYTDGVAKSATSAADGSYSFTVSRNWTGSVTPSKACYTFSPLSLPYTGLNVDQASQDYTFALDPGSGCANVAVSVGPALQGTYGIASGSQAHPLYPGEFDGAVRVQSTNATAILVSERQIFGSSFSESMGIPANQLTTEYWFPWYDGLTMHTWITIGAPSTNTGAAIVDVYIGNSGMPIGTYSVAPGSQVHPDYPGVFDGAVRVVSTNGKTIFVSGRSLEAALPRRWPFHPIS